MADLKKTEINRNLFADFDAVTEAQWKQKIQYDLKGEDYQSSVVTPTREGIPIKPFYHASSTPQINIPSRATANWYISQPIFAGNAALANKRAKKVLDRGADGISFTIPHGDIDPKELLAGLPENGIQIHLSFFDVAYINRLREIHSTVHVHVDILNRLVTDGNWHENQKADFLNHEKFIKLSESYFSNITVNTGIYVESGANAVQELAYFASQLNEYLNHYFHHNNETDLGSKIPTKRINIDTRIGSNYFMEIAKYRAYRIITKSLGDLYNLELESYITATPAIRNKSVLDYNVNLLRTSTEYMSAILGGVDTICPLPYDAFFNKENEFGNRIARNQLLLLKEEAYFDKVSNAVDGAYYIESLTEQLTEKALNLFKSLEQAGGFIQNVFEGTIQRKIKESAQLESQNIASGKRVLVGVNKYLNTTQAVKTEFEIYPFVKMNPRKTLVTPLIPSRLAESFEKASL